MNRFNGGCEPLAKVSVDDLIAWITEENRIWEKPSDRPCVVVDPLFLQNRTDRCVWEVMAFFPGCKPTGISVTATNPGDYVPYHTDLCASGWFSRIHVPIVTNPECYFITDDEVQHHMEVGMSYQVYPARRHAVANFGDTVRVHLMFDVVQ